MYISFQYSVLQFFPPAINVIYKMTSSKQKNMIMQIATGKKMAILKANRKHKRVKRSRRKMANFHLHRN